MTISAAVGGKEELKVRALPKDDRWWDSYGSQGVS